jgi:hypothetical protein
VACASWNDIWLNEGGASHGEALWEMSFGGYTGYINWLMRRRERYLTRNGNQIPIYNPGIDNVFNVATTYDKSGWVYHMILSTVGQENYFPVMRKYFDEFAFKSLETEDFVKFWEREYPNPPIAWRTFFDQWIYGAGHPIYDIQVNSLGGETEVRVMQSAYPDWNDLVFANAVDIEFVYSDTTIVEQVIIDEVAENFTFNHNRLDVPTVAFDPLNKVLCEKNDFVVSVEDDFTKGVSSMEVFPNTLSPADNATVEIFVVEPVESANIVVTDILGNTLSFLHQGGITQGVHRFPLTTNALSAGMYFVTAQIGGDKISTNILVR